MASSVSQYWRRSLPETSALLPVATNDDTPRPSWSSRRSRAAPIVPDCDDTATRPGLGATSAKVASSRTSGAVLTTPMVLGPMSRIPSRRAWSTSSALSPAPSAPVSAKPAEMTTRPCTRLRPHCSTTSATWSAGTTTTARSISSGTSRIDGWARTLATTSASGLTG